MDSSLRTLTLRYFDEDLTHEEIIDLREFLRAAPEAIDEFVTIVRREAMLVELVRCESEAAGAAEPALAEEKPPLGFRRWLAPLAAAASIAVIAGAAFFFQSGSDAGLRVARKVGDVRVGGRDIATSAKSFCRMQYGDGTVVALDQNTAVVLSAKRQAAGKRMELKSGRAYLDVRKQAQPLVVKSGCLTTEVLGTRLMVNRAGQGMVMVLDGQAKVSADGAAVRLRDLQKVLAGRLGDRNILMVRTDPVAGSDVVWLEQTETDAASLPAWNPRSFLEGDPSMDFDNYTVTGGAWDIQPEGRDVLIGCKGGGADHSMIFLGGPMWTKGVLSFEFKVGERGPKTEVGVALVSRDLYFESFTSSTALRQFAATGYRGWLKMRVAFEVMPGDMAVAREFAVWPEENPSDRAVARDWGLKENARNRGGVRGIGLVANDCSVEFRNLKLENTDPAISARRATDGLLVQYFFNEGRGTVVRDVSGAGVPLNLTIQKPDQVRWLDRGIAVDGNAKMASATAGKVAEAWRKSGGLTLEFWDRPTGLKVGDHQYALVDFIWKQGWFNYTQVYAGGAVANHVKHSVVTLTRKGDDINMRAYVDGVQTLEKDLLQSLGRFIEREPFMLQIPGGGAANMEQKTFPWTGELYAAAVYGRALTPDQILGNCRAGVPQSVTPLQRPEETLGLYLFRQGKGTTIGNQARIGTLGTLVITHPALARWTPRGLTVNSGAEVKWVDSSRILRRTWNANRGLTFEMWFRLPGEASAESKSCAYAHIAAGPFRMAFATPPAAGMDPDTLRCGVYTIAYENGSAVARFYADGMLQWANAMPDFGPLLDLPVEMCIGPAVPGMDSRQLRTFEVCGAAVHGRALTDDEIRERYGRGLPEVTP